MRGDRPHLAETGEMPRRRQVGVDWHRVVMWSSLGVAAVLLIYRGLARDGRIVTIFTAEGRDLFRRTLRLLLGY